MPAEVASDRPRSRSRAAEEQPAAEEAVADGPTDEFIVTFAPGTDNGKKLGLMKEAGVKDGKAIGNGDMQLVEVPARRPGARPSASSRTTPPSRPIDPNYERTINAAPNDPAYADQWALPKHRLGCRLRRTTHRRLRHRGHPRHRRGRTS